LETLDSKGFSIPAIFWLQTQLVALTPNTDCHIIIRAGKHPAVAIIGFLTLTGKTPCRDGALPIPKGFRQYSGNRKVGNREKIAIPTNTP